MKQITRIGILSLSFLATCLVWASSKGETHWGYAGHKGPSHWGKLNKDWAKCSAGKQQSPINLKWKKPRNNRKIEFHYSSSLFNVLDNGHTIQASFKSENYAMIEGHRYDLLQLHFHAHSEHSIASQFYPLEMHLVHADKKGNYAVVGVMFKEGKMNKELEKIFSHIPSKKNHKMDVSKNININSLIPGIKTHYHYMGSLTTPPCSEGINWNVLNTPIFASAKQLAHFKKMYSSNYRPIQELHGRKPANY